MAASRFSASIRVCTGKGPTCDMSWVSPTNAIGRARSRLPSLFTGVSCLIDPTRRSV
jgi:hypothetical protein